MRVDNKYHYNIDVGDMDILSETSHSKLLRMVKPGGKVLEFGPASGVMTRYMKNKLGCQVYIVEFDKDSYQLAIQYAVDGWCGDIEDGEWIEKFADARFDTIIFADVLEHLKDPEKVLSLTKEMLADDGSVIFSVPNIAFGDIVMNLMCDRFQYTSLGLLDNTHLRFFARESLKPFAQQAGYTIVYETCTFVPLFLSEQGTFIPEGERAELERMLVAHRYRNVYQFICRLVKIEFASQINIESDVEKWGLLREEHAYESKLYFDCGKGYNETNRILFTWPKTKGGRSIYEVELPNGCISVRFDPVEYQKCILNSTEVTVDGVPVEIRNLNGIHSGAWDFFCIEDPQMAVTVPHGSKQLRIETTITILGNNGWREIFDFVSHNNQENQSRLDAMEQQLETMNGSKAQMEVALKNVQEALAVKDEQLQIITRSVARAQDEMTKAKNESDVLRHHYNLVVKKCRQLESEVSVKNERLQTATRSVARAQNETTKAKNDCDVLRHNYNLSVEYCRQLEAEITAMKASASWKITKPLRSFSSERKKKVGN
ncbi:Methyltransferase type 12 [Desulfitobacterium hafniense DCB-2]|uniref:Methyltransferase type 12 n=1 Tax=Desulfitobacterium hafniense (strain DSM 10664 / DCB-2) TaxID=272564 RepID=B8FVR5_DESHD|nr:class I SAM-dependent methyltransferase [Desulfitobacterium hafniense]ACL22467.1 Methyltransferase type 12 [Desulfitobacterium hafniense DCB-2]